MFVSFSFYLLLSKMGLVGTGQITRKLLEAEALLAKERALRESLVLEGSIARQELNDKLHEVKVQNAGILAELAAERQRTEFYKTELERERKAVREWIDELEKITGLEAKIRGLDTPK